MSLLDSSFEILSGNGHNKGLRLNVTLFRRDDMKSVQILEEAACSDIDSSIDRLRDRKAIRGDEQRAK